MKKPAIISILLLIGTITLQAQTAEDYFRLTKKYLDSFTSYEYTLTSKSTAAFDTTTYVNMLTKYAEVNTKKDDSLFRSTFRLSSNLSDHPYLLYDGKRVIKLSENYNTYEIIPISSAGDKLKYTSGPYFSAVYRFIDFSLNYDDVTVKIKENTSEHVVIEVFFPNNRFEFSNNIPAKQGREGYSWSQYFIWIRKKDYFPFRWKRVQEHQKTERTIESFKSYDDNRFEIDALEEIPESFRIRNDGDFLRKKLEGTSMKELFSESVDGFDLQTLCKGKLAVIQFTSASCGPCVLSVDELKALRSKFSKEELYIAAIESYIFNKEKVNQITKKYDLNYPYLVGSESLRKKAGADGVPQFFIVDREGVIQKVLIGFAANKTMPEIEEYLNSF